MAKTRGLPSNCHGAIRDTPHAPCTVKPGKALLSHTAGENVPSFSLAAFPAELLEEISRSLHRFGLQG